MPRQSQLRFTFEIPGVMDFEVVEFWLTEALSETFVLELDLASTDPSVDFGKVLDQVACLTVWDGERPVRYVHGLVSSLEQGETGFRRTRYRAVVEPPLSRLKLCADWRIYQEQSVPQILAAMLKAHGVLHYAQEATGEHLTREYCVQAGETDYDFWERIAREEGFFYWFRHTREGCELVQSDRLFIQGRIDGAPVIYNANAGGDAPGPAVHRFRYVENVRTARQTQRDYVFTHTRYKQEHRLDGEDLDHQGRAYENYRYPGRYKVDEAGKPMTRNRLLGHRRDARMAYVEGDDPRLLPGLSFDLQGHPRASWNAGWRVIRMQHHGVQHTSQGEESAGAEQGTHYGYTAEVVPVHTEWRAEPLPKPRIDGPQPAIVVGPPGEEIYCDKWGRVKIQFPWDRQGEFNDFSSCWVRAAQNWAGAQWGHMAIPRIGQEVVVLFMNSDPDQPLIVARTYMSTQLPPYELPKHKTRMSIKSKTHKGEGYNELRFEDENGQEEVYVHAQRDQNIHVNRNETTFVGNDRSENVGHDEAIAIGNDRSETVGHDETIRIGATRKVTIGGHKTETVTKTKTETIGLAKALSIGGAYQTSVGAAMNTTVALSQSAQVGVSKSTVVGKAYSITVGDEFRLTVGKSSLVMKSDGTVLLNGVKLDINGSEHVQVSGKAVDLN